jgi:hypothetical protein
VRPVIDVPSELVADLDRVVTKLRTTPTNRLAAPLPGPFPSRVEAGRALARTLAIAAQGIEEADHPLMPVWRTLPLIADVAVGDQVRVLGHDLVTSLAAGADVVWTPAGRADIHDLLRDVTDAVSAVIAFL